MKRAMILTAVLSIFGCFIVLAETTLTYNDNIKPVLTQKCFSCHDWMGSYDTFTSHISSQSTITNGLKIIYPAKPDSSVIIWRLEGKTVSGAVLTQMPFGSAALDAQTITMFRTWITQGANEKNVVDVKESTWSEIKKKFM